MQKEMGEGGGGGGLIAQLDCLGLGTPTLNSGQRPTPTHTIILGNEFSLQKIYRAPFLREGGLPPPPPPCMALNNDVGRVAPNFGTKPDLILVSIG